MNPLDRNHDGKVDLKDLSARQQPGMVGQQGLAGQQPLLANQQGMVGGAHMNPLDRNHDGRVDLKDLSARQQPGMVGQQGFVGQPGMVGQPGLVGGAHHNPLDRNHDGRVDLHDLSGRQTTGLDRNHDGIDDRLQGGRRLSNGQMMGAPGLDRNHDGIDDRLQGGQTTYIQSERRASLVRAEPTHIETVQKNVVVHEHIHPIQKEEIQPIIYREREQLDVKQVTQMMHETQIQPTIVQQRELPAERREAIIERGAAIQENFIAPSRSVDQTTRTQVVHAPIVNEVIKKTIIEEIQPVLERDIIQSTVIQNTQPIYEKIVEAPMVYRETTIVQDRGIINGDLAALEAQGFNLGATGRRLSQGYSQTYIQQGLAQQGLDRNHDGIDDRLQGGRRLSNGQMMGQPGMVGQGIPLATSHGLQQPGVVGHHNPLDRNHDGRVDLHDLSGRQASGLDRNHDGIDDRLQGGRRLSNGQMMGQPGMVGQPGMMNQGAHMNPLDRNHDGRVDLHDLSGRQNQPGMIGQGMAGQQTGMMGGAHMNPLDRNHDGKVDLKDLSGRPAQTANPSVINTL